MSFSPLKAVSCLRMSVIELLPPRHEIDFRSFRMGFWWRKSHWDRLFPEYFRFLPSLWF